MALEVLLEVAFVLLEASHMVQPTLRGGALQRYGKGGRGH